MEKGNIPFLILLCTFLSYLHLLPVDALKIDRSFVILTQWCDKNLVIAESIIALCKSMGLSAIAEGIETEAQQEWLRNQGCQLGQGYLFSPPVTVSIATDMLLNNLPMKYN